MNDDKPLWYDHSEPDERPGPILLLLAGVFAALAGAAAFAWRIIWLPDRIWVALSTPIVRGVRRRLPLRR